MDSKIKDGNDMFFVVVKIRRSPFTGLQNTITLLLYLELFLVTQDMYFNHLNQ